MSKNVIIIILSIIVVLLVGILIVTNYRWFSDEWYVGLLMVVGSVVGGGIFVYMKIKRT